MKYQGLWSIPVAENTKSIADMVEQLNNMATYLLKSRDDGLIFHKMFYESQQQKYLAVLGTNNKDLADKMGLTEKNYDGELINES